MRPRRRETEAEAVWQIVQIEWVNAGWARLEGVMEREPRLSLVGVLVLLAVTGVIGVSAVAALPPVGRVVASIVLLPVLFVAVGWVVLPWVISTDRRRALLPVGVMVVGVALSCVGGWALLLGVGVLLVAAALGMRELRFIGRDVELDRLRE